MPSPLWPVGKLPNLAQHHQPVPVVAGQGQIFAGNGHQSALGAQDDFLLRTGVDTLMLLHDQLFISQQHGAGPAQHQFLGDLVPLFQHAPASRT